MSCALPNESNIVALLPCEQALLFGRVKRVSQERASGRRSPSLARSREACFACPNRRACSQAMELPAWATKEKRNVGSCCLKSFTGFKIWATTLNNTQQHATTGKRLWKRTQRPLGSCLPNMLRPFDRASCHVNHVLFWVPFDENFYSSSGCA